MKLRRTMKAQSPKKNEKRIIIIKKKEEDLGQARGHVVRISIRGYIARRASRPYDLDVLF